MDNLPIETPLFTEQYQDFQQADIGKHAFQALSMFVNQDSASFQIPQLSRWE
jgi:hypothetical protein